MVVVTHSPNCILKTIDLTYCHESRLGTNYLHVAMYLHHHPDHFPTGFLLSFQLNETKRISDRRITTQECQRFPHARVVQPNVSTPLNPGNDTALSTDAIIFPPLLRLAGFTGIDTSNRRHHPARHDGGMSLRLQAGLRYRGR